MGLSLMSSLQVLASRTKTSERAGVLLVSFVKDGGHAGKAEQIYLATANANCRNNALQRGSFFCDLISQVFTSSFIISLSCVCLWRSVMLPLRWVTRLPVENSVCMWDRITSLPCDWFVLRQTSNNKTLSRTRTPAPSSTSAKLFECKQAGRLLSGEMYQSYCREGDKL